MTQLLQRVSIWKVADEGVAINFVYLFDLPRASRTRQQRRRGFYR